LSAHPPATQQIADHETLSRYIYFSGHFSPRESRVKHEAFMPPSDLQLSVFRVNSLTEQQIWQIGNDVAGQTQRTLRGRGDVLTAEVRGLGLDAVPATPPPHHAHIIGWPGNDKGKQKLIALQLAAAASLVLKP